MLELTDSVYNRVYLRNPNNLYDPIYKFFTGHKPTNRKMFKKKNYIEYDGKKLLDVWLYLGEKNQRDIKNSISRNVADKELVDERIWALFENRFSEFCSELFWKNLFCSVVESLGFNLEHLYVRANKKF